MLNVSDRLLAMVIGVLGLVLFTVIVFSGLLALQDKSIPDLFGQLAIGCLTGLAGLLVQREKA